MNDQWCFDFKNWEEAFEMFYRKKKKDSAFCLVVSTDSYTSGYWVERSATSDSKNRVYRSIKAVKGLERRVRAERASTVNASLGGVVV